MTTLVNGSLVVVDDHSAFPKVFWEGEEVQGVKDIYITYRYGYSRAVEFVVRQDPAVEGMRQAGIAVYPAYEPHTPLPQDT